MDGGDKEEEEREPSTQSIRLARLDRTSLTPTALRNELFDTHARTHGPHPLSFFHACLRASRRVIIMSNGSGLRPISVPWQRAASFDLAGPAGMCKCPHTIEPMQQRFQAEVSERVVRCGRPPKFVTTADSKRSEWSSDAVPCARLWMDFQQTAPTRQADFLTFLRFA